MHGYRKKLLIRHLSKDVCGVGLWHKTLTALPARSTTYDKKKNINVLQSTCNLILTALSDFLGLQTIFHEEL